MNRTIHGNCPCIQLAFSAYRTQLAGKQSAPLERASNTCLELKLELYLHLLCVCTWFLPLQSMGIQTSRYGYIRTAPHIQPKRNTYAIWVLCSCKINLHKIREPSFIGQCSHFPQSLSCLLLFKFQVPFIFITSCIISFLFLIFKRGPIPIMRSLRETNEKK